MIFSRLGIKKALNAAEKPVSDWFILTMEPSRFEPLTPCMPCVLSPSPLPSNSLSKVLQHNALERYTIYLHEQLGANKGRNHTKTLHTEHLHVSQLLMVKTAPWLKDLRGTIKRTYGPGWVLEERSGYFKIQRRDSGNARDGKRPTITTSIAYAPSSSTEWLVLIGELKRRMAT